MYVVYALEDPRDHLYHYIGITNDVYARFQQHVTGDCGNIKKNGWIFECRQANVMIIMREIERVDAQVEAEQREQFWISYYLHLGHPLQNVSKAQHLLEEKARLESQYQQLLESNARLKELIDRAMDERHSPKQALELQVVAFRQQGFTLQQIMLMTGLRYNQVQRIAAKTKAIS